jgi:hypothetical protein
VRLAVTVGPKSGRARAACSVVLLALATAGIAKKSDWVSPLNVSGYVHAQWRYDLHVGTYPRQSFDLRRLRVKFKCELGRVGTDVELGCDELAPSIQDAFITYRVMPALELKGGLGKMPFSREELTPAGRLLTIERGLTNGAFGDRGYLGRDIGFSVGGELFPNRLPMTYEAGVYNGNGARASLDYNNAKQFAERVTARPFNWLALGLNATQRNDSLSGLLVNAYGGDFSCRFGAATLDGEVLAGNSEPDKEMLGAQLAAAYRFGPVEPVLRLERFYPDLAVRNGCQTALTLGGNWYLDRRLLFKSNVTSDVAPGSAWGHRFVLQAQASF